MWPRHPKERQLSPKNFCIVSHCISKIFHRENHQCSNTWVKKQMAGNVLRTNHAVYKRSASWYSLVAEYTNTHEPVTYTRHNFEQKSFSAYHTLEIRRKPRSRWIELKLRAIISLFLACAFSFCFFFMVGHHHFSLRVLFFSQITAWSIGVTSFFFPLPRWLTLCENTAIITQCWHCVETLTDIVWT